MDGDIAYAADAEIDYLDDEMLIREEPYCCDCCDSSTITIYSDKPGGIVLEVDCDHTGGLESAPVGGWPVLPTTPADDPWAVEAAF